MYICINPNLPIHPIPHVSMFVLYICVSVSALQTCSYALYVNLYFILYSIFFYTFNLKSHGLSLRYLCFYCKSPQTFLLQTDSYKFIYSSTHPTKLLFGAEGNSYDLVPKFIRISDRS